MKAFPAETTEAFRDGHNAAFRYFGGVTVPAKAINSIRPSRNIVVHPDSHDAEDTGRGTPKPTLTARNRVCSPVF